MLFLAAPLVAAVFLLLWTSHAASGEQWKLCRHPGATFTCGTAPCIYIIASFATNEECVKAKNSRNFPAGRASNQDNTGKPAGAAGLAECRRRYGKSVTHAALSKNNNLICHQQAPQSDDPNVMRDVCKKQFGPMSQIRRHRGKWYCTA